jgi:hypothetical protein
MNLGKHNKYRGPSINYIGFVYLRLMICRRSSAWESTRPGARPKG